jgi:hypothetical protein
MNTKSFPVYSASVVNNSNQSGVTSPDELSPPVQTNSIPQVLIPEQEIGTKFGSHTATQVVSPQPENGHTQSQPIEKQKNIKNRCLLKVSSVFPWSFFPTTMHVEESKVIFDFHQFLAKQSHSIEIRDISNIFIESSIFFATLRIICQTYTQNDFKIDYLQVKEAIQAQRIIEGLRIFSHYNVNTFEYELEELLQKIDEMHESASVS